MSYKIRRTKGQEPEGPGDRGTAQPRAAWTGSKGHEEPQLGFRPHLPLLLRVSASRLSPHICLSCFSLSPSLRLRSLFYPELPPWLEGLHPFQVGMAVVAPGAAGPACTSVAVPPQSAQSLLGVARPARERCFRFQVVEANEFLSLWTLWVVRQVNLAFTWGHCRPSLVRSGKRLVCTTARPWLCAQRWLLGSSIKLVTAAGQLQIREPRNHSSPDLCPRAGRS